MLKIAEIYQIFKTLIDGTFLFQVHFPNRLREEEYGVRSSLEKLLRMEKKHWSVSSCTP